MTLAEFADQIRPILPLVWLGVGALWLLASVLRLSRRQEGADTAFIIFLLCMLLGSR